MPNTDTHTQANGDFLLRQKSPKGNCCCWLSNVWSSRIITNEPSNRCLSHVVVCSVKQRRSLHTNIEHDDRNYHDDNLALNIALATRASLTCCCFVANSICIWNCLHLLYSIQLYQAQLVISIVCLFASALNLRVPKFRDFETVKNKVNWKQYYWQIWLNYA